MAVKTLTQKEIDMVFVMLEYKFKPKEVAARFGVRVSRIYDMNRKKRVK